MQSPEQRVVITGMAINTPLGDTLAGTLDAMLSGRSALSRWRFTNTDGIYSKVGGDLSGYDALAKMQELAGYLPEPVAARARRLVKRAPFSTRLSILAALDAWLDAELGLDEVRLDTSVIVGGHNLNKNYQHENYLQFVEEPDYIDSQASLSSLDTDHAACVGEALGLRGPIYTVGGACASANIALRCGVDEIRHHGSEVAVVVGPVLDFAPMDLHAMALMGAISFQSFNHEPTKASRPYDTRREGFIPSHGAATLVLERLSSALARGARIYAEVLGVTTLSDGCHLPSPSVEGQSRTMERLLRHAQVAPDEVDWISAHATSTPLGDLTELRSIEQVFGEHTRRLRINAPKSMLGHTCWSAPVVETVVAVLQMHAGVLHPSINIDELDPKVKVDVCANRAVEHRVETFLKNSFGFGGINCCGLYRRFDPTQV